MSLSHFSQSNNANDNHPYSRNLNHYFSTKANTSLNPPEITQSIILSPQKRIKIPKPFNRHFNQSLSNPFSFQQSSKKSIQSSPEGEFSTLSPLPIATKTITKIKLFKTINHNQYNKRLESLDDNINEQKLIATRKINMKEQKEVEDIMAKRSALRKIKRKVCKLMTKSPLNICDSFNRNNNNFNDKFMTLITGDNYFNKSKLYHRNFHYHSNELSEGHDKYNMIIDCDKFKRTLVPPKEVFNDNFSNVEKKVIREDPPYFFANSNMIIGIKDLKIKPLKEKLNDEERQLRKAKKKSLKHYDYDDNDHHDKKTNDYLYGSIKKNALRDPRFNWTSFDNKIDNAMTALKEKLNKAHSMKELRNKLQPVLPKKIQEEINKNFRRVYDIKNNRTIQADFTKTLPRKEYRFFMIHEASKRLINEIKIFKARKVIVKKENDKAFYQQQTMDQIRDNILERKKDDLSSRRLRDKQDFNRDKPQN